MNAIQQAIYDKIYNWKCYAHGTGKSTKGEFLVSPDYYYSRLVKSGVADEPTLKTELRNMLDRGLITAKVVKFKERTEATLYDIDPSTDPSKDTVNGTATLLSLPEAVEQEIIDKYAKTKTKR